MFLNLNQRFVHVNKSLIIIYSTKVLIFFFLFHYNLSITFIFIFSHISGIMLLAVPADIYLYGTTYSLSVFTAIVIYVVALYVYIPVFYKLQLTSVYEYLKIRFNTKIRTISSVLFLLSSLLYLPIVIYIPALAFSKGNKMFRMVIFVYSFIFQQPV